MAFALGLGFRAACAARLGEVIGVCQGRPVVVDHPNLLGLDGASQARASELIFFWSSKASCFFADTQNLLKRLGDVASLIKFLDLRDIRGDFWQTLCTGITSIRFDNRAIIEGALPDEVFFTVASSCTSMIAFQNGEKVVLTNGFKAMTLLYCLRLNSISVRFCLIRGIEKVLDQNIGQLKLEELPHFTFPSVFQLFWVFRRPFEITTYLKKFSEALGLPVSIVSSIIRLLVIRDQDTPLSTDESNQIAERVAFTTPAQVLCIYNEIAIHLPTWKAAMESGQSDFPIGL
jgi:hypothetical protein